MFHRFHCRSIESVELDARSDELVLTCEYEPDRGKVAIRLQAEAGEALVNVLRDKLRLRSIASNEARHRLVRDATAVTLPSGEVWVGFKIDGFDTPILMRPEMVAQLREALAKLPD
jgi:hypothetical protein